MDTEENVNVVEQSHKENVMPKSSFLNRKVLIIIACFLFVVIGIGGFKIYDYLTSFHPYQKQEYNSEKKKMGNVYILKRYFPATEIKTGDLFYDDEKTLYVEVHNMSKKPIKFDSDNIEIKVRGIGEIKNLSWEGNDIIEPGYKLTLKNKDIVFPFLTKEEQKRDEKKIQDLRIQLTQSRSILEEQKMTLEKLDAFINKYQYDPYIPSYQKDNLLVQRQQLINDIAEHERTIKNGEQLLNNLTSSLEKLKNEVKLQEFIEYISYRPKENPGKGAIIKF